MINPGNSVCWLFHFCVSKKSMKQFFIKQFGTSWKTKLLGYIVAMMLAVQPLLNIEVDFSKRTDVFKYILRVFFAATIAVMGKYVGESSASRKVGS